MSLQPLISVIVPVYNVEKYLANCIDSIMNQTYSNLEIILVNDGSKDNSWEICLAYAEKDDRIHAYTQTNAGPSVARNRGLDVAHGDYIAFVDSDDTIKDTMYETLLYNLEENKVDLSLCGMQKVYSNGNKQLYYEGLESKKMENDEIERVFFNNSCITFAPVDKLYPRTVIGDTRFDESIKMCEDQKFIYDILKRVKSVYYDAEALYIIRMTEGSLSRTKATRYHLAMIDVNDYIIADTESDLMKNHGERYKAEICLSYFVPNYYNGEFSKSDISHVNEIIKKNAPFLFKYGDKKTKIKLVLFCFSPKLLSKILNQKRQKEEEKYNKEDRYD